MFTPPPSPDPRHTQRKASSSPTIKTDVADDPFLSPASDRSRSPTPDSSSSRAHDTPLSPKEDPYMYAQLQKKRVGRRTRWAVVLVPLVLVFVALSTRLLTHPTAFDVLSSRTPDWAAVKDWSPHKRHAAPDDAPTTTSDVTTLSSTTPTGTSLSIAASSSAEPTSVSSGATTVPDSPPVLPTPFPQPFDSTFSSNFSTVGCENFMSNMTQTSPFRECRAFSLLVGDSNAFITSQRNITELNIIIWGTCNTDLSADQCTSNMAWFEANIESACKEDIAADNALVTDAVSGLQAYTLMREAACQVDQDTDTYCFVEAAQSTHPSDLYLYQLPLGLSLPNTTVPSCSGCVQSLMGTYAQNGMDLPKLQETYGAAATIVNAACGSTFVSTVNSTSGNGASALWGRGASGGGLGYGYGMVAGAAVGAALLVL